MGTRVTVLAKNKYLNEFLGFPIHVVIAGIVCTIIGVILGFVVTLVVSGLAASIDLKVKIFPFLFDIAFGPMVWGPAVFIGFLVNERMRQRVPCWIGPLFVLLFLLLMSWDISRLSQVPYYQHYTQGHYWKYEYEQLIAIKPYCGGDECLGKLLFTTPTVCSIAYSIGAWFGLRSRTIGRARK